MHKHSNPNTAIIAMMALENIAGAAEARLAALEIEYGLVSIKPSIY